MASPDLVLCPLTLRDGLFEYAPERYAEMLDLAPDYGYRRVDLSVLDLEMAEAAGRPREEFLEQFPSRGLSTPVVDAISGWSHGASDKEIEARALPVLEVAVEARAQTVLALSTESTLPSVAVAGRGFAHVCALAADRGLGVCIEFFPWGGISDIAKAWQVIEASGAANGGIVLDTWHWARSPNPRADDLATLRTIPAERIHLVQLDDAAPEPDGDPMRETLRARLLPGKGAPGTLEVLRTLHEMGAAPLFAPEVFNPELYAEGQADMMRLTADASRAVLAEAGYV